MLGDGAFRPRSAYRVLRNSAILTVAVGLFAFAIAIQTKKFHPLGQVIGLVDVHAVADGSTINGGWSLLRRDTDGINITYNVTGVPAGHVVILKAVIFNQPEFCSGGAGGCGPDDMNNSRAQPSVMFATGGLLRGSSDVMLKTRLTVKDSARAVSGEGLTNPLDAYVQIVLVDHGVPGPGMFAEMVSTVGGGCKDAAPGTGMRGPNTCTDLQVANHPK